ncbi:MAG: hypothetical protein ABIU09_09755 [Pyrinomonadaceae bacterium]
MSEEQKAISDEEFTLHEFLEQNQKPIAVVGVFAALGVIWKTAWQSEQILYCISLFLHNDSNFVGDSQQVSRT